MNTNLANNFDSGKSQQNQFNSVFVLFYCVIFGTEQRTQILLVNFNKEKLLQNRDKGRKIFNRFLLFFAVLTAAMVLNKKGKPKRNQ